MKKILFITTRNPFSGRFSGDVIRSSRIIKFLRKKYNVDVLFLGKEEKLNNNKNITYSFKYPNYLLKVYYCLKSFLKLQPIQFGLFHSPKLKNYVQQNSYKYNILFFHQIRSMQYLPEGYKGKTILEMGDLYSQNYYQTYKNISLFNLFYYFYFIESLLVKKAENKSFNFFNKIILFSKKEINQINNKFKKKITHIPESVNIIKKEYKYSIKNYKILFIGNLGYLPNKLACADFVKKILPKISLKFPDIEFHIIGNINKIDKFFLTINSKVKAIGQKKIINNYIKKSICGLANLKIATGIQGKVLTYMSYGLPAICSNKVYSNFGSTTLNYKNEKELINHITQLKLNKKKSQVYSKKSQNYIKNFMWKKISANYNKLIKNLF